MGETGLGFCAATYETGYTTAFMGTLGRLAAITGASAGIGATFARQLAGQGYDLMLVARRTASLEQLAEEIRAKHGVSVECITADLTRDEDVAAVGRRLSAADRLFLLVNNAGFGTRAYFFEADPAREDAMHRLHVLATERLTRAALPGMVARREGGIINVASVAGFLQSVRNISYCATKAWMISFSEGLHLEMRQKAPRVVIQALCPGYTFSEFHDVAGVDRSEIPKNWWMPSEFVVSESLRGFREGKLLVIPGWRYKAIVGLVKVLPRSLFLAGAARVRGGPR